MNETLMTDGQHTHADTQQNATAHTETQQHTSDSEHTEPDVTESGQQAADEGAPEKYEFTQPDGQQFDSAVLAAYSEIAKELKLPQAHAQKVIDKVAPVIQARQAEHLAQVKQDWAAAATIDKEFGGDNLQINMSAAKKALDAFGTPELKGLLEETGLGNHPEVIRMFYRAGKAIQQDTVVMGAVSNSASPSIEHRLYPNMK